MPEENKEDKGLQSELDDILEGFVPPPTTASETLVEEAPVEPKKPTVEEDKSNVEEGKERPPEAPSEQVPPAVGAEEDKDKGKVEGEPPVAAAPAEPPITPTQAPAQPPAAQPETNEQRLIRENEELRQQMVEIAGRMVEGPKPVAKTPEQIEQERQQASRAVLGFIKNPEQYDEVFKSHENFNALLTSVVNTSVERAIRMIPQVTTQYVDQQFTLRTAAYDFYRENEDLLPHKKYVGFITNEVQAEHPDWALADILVEAEKRTRTRLKLPKPTVGEGSPQQVVQPSGNARSSRTVDNPGFTPGAGGGGRRTVGSSPLTGEAAEISDLIS